MLMVIIAVLILGLAIGSFVNAVVWRIYQGHRGQGIGDSSRYSVWTGRSMCPECKHQLAAIDLVPVFSWLWLGGKCRYCSKPISVQYPLVELATAGLFGLSYLSLESLVTSLDLGLWFYFLTVLIILAVYDWKHYILPDKVLVPAIVVALAQIVVNSALSRDLAYGGWILVSGLVAGGAFYALAAGSKGKWMGGGDIKLVFFMGLLLGWPKIAVALLIAFNAAAIVGVTLIALKRKKRSDHIPFGPFLVAGTIIAMLYGSQIVDRYLQGINF